MRENDSTLTAEVVRAEESREIVNTHIKVHEDNEWVGDFFVDFERHRDVFMADWASVKSGGNGIYVDSDPAFWAVEEAAEQLNSQHPHRAYKAINSGPNDK